MFVDNKHSIKVARWSSG